MKKFIKELIPYIIIIIVVMLIRTYLVTPVIVSGDSMYPTLKNNEVLLLSKITYRVSDIERFDVVVINVNKDLPNGKKLKTKIIKRVIGLPGEYIEYKNNTLYVDGKELDNEYNFETKDFSLEDISRHTKIPEDKYLVLGDNRSVSADSREIGLISKKDISGMAIFRIWPITKLSKVK